MDVLKEEYNPHLVDTAFEEGFIHPRITLHIKKGETHYRFIKDIVARSINGWTFEPLPYMRFGTITTSSGAVSDSVIITLDAVDLINGTSAEVKTAFQNVVALPLRGASMQLGTMMLDRDTMQPDAIKADFCGLINGIEYSEENRDIGPVLEAECLSFLTVAKRQPVRRYMDVDHRRIHPGDDSFQALSDVVARQATFDWNYRKSGARGGVTSNVGARNTIFDQVTTQLR